jgi:hypothetical protein
MLVTPHGYDAMSVDIHMDRASQTSVEMHGIQYVYIYSQGLDIQLPEARAELMSH